jgi:hypothetical protein
MANDIEKAIEAAKSRTGGSGGGGGMLKKIGDFLLGMAGFIVVVTVLANMGGEMGTKLGAALNGLIQLILNMSSAIHW